MRYSFSFCFVLFLIIINIWGLIFARKQHDILQCTVYRNWEGGNINKVELYNEFVISFGLRQTYGDGYYEKNILQIVSLRLLWYFLFIFNFLLFFSFLVKILSHIYFFRDFFGIEPKICCQQLLLTYCIWLRWLVLVFISKS